MKRIILIILLFFITVYIYCNDNQSNENNDSDNKKVVIVEAGIVITEQSEQVLGNVNIGLCFGINDISDKEIMMILHGPIIGFETNFDNINGIRIGYFFDLYYVYDIGFNFRFNGILYNNNANQWDFRLQPEIGLTLYNTIFGVTYGYNFALETINKEIGYHRVTLYFRIPLL